MIGVHMYLRVDLLTFSQVYTRLEPLNFDKITVSISSSMEDFCLILKTDTFKRKFYLYQTTSKIKIRIFQLSLINLETTLCVLSVDIIYAMFLCCICSFIGEFLRRDRFVELMEL